MATLWLITATLLLSIITAQQDCGRLRKAWHTLTDAERLLYITGIKTLSASGKLQSFTRQHGDSTSAMQAHSTSAFLPWHRYLLWEIESQIRDISPVYECFAMPYWDWSFEQTQNFTDITEAFILNSGLGNVGSIATVPSCLTDGAFRAGEYTPYACYHSDVHDCCLERGACTISCGFDSPQTTFSNILDWDQYGSDESSRTANGYRIALENGAHGNAHNTIGAGGHLSNLANSPDDPIFYLLHSFVDFNWALWQDCHNADQIHENDIPSWVYDGTLSPPRRFWENRGPSRLDDELVFTVLEDQSWSYLSQNGFVPTIRNMHDIQRWDVQYDQGTFFGQAKLEESGLCPDVNSSWFTSDRKLFTSDNDGDDDDYRVSFVSSDGTVYEEFADETYPLLRAAGGFSSKIDSRMDTYDTWARMTCDFAALSYGRICTRPKYFDDCSDMAVNRQTGDIDITLDELLGKAGLSECMEETRVKYYNWAAQTHTLYGLCAGYYDNFCETKWMQTANGNGATCVDKVMDVLGSGSYGRLSTDSSGGEYQDGKKDEVIVIDDPANEDGGDSLPTHMRTDAPAPQTDASVNIMLFGDESIFRMTGLSDWDKIVISTFMNGVMFMIVITFCTGLHCIYSNKYAGFAKVSFEDMIIDDDDQ